MVAPLSAAVVAFGVVCLVGRRWGLPAPPPRPVVMKPRRYLCPRRNHLGRRPRDRAAGRAGGLGHGPPAGGGRGEGGAPLGAARGGGNMAALGQVGKLRHGETAG